ncbi:MAG: threonine/serine exporter ThrE family protein, partial [Gemmiger sp.]
MTQTNNTPPERELTLITEAGRTLLENGGEVFRAQQTMEIMARSLGVEGFHVYVITNGIFASAGDSPLTEIRHIPCTAVNLSRVEAVNELSRELADGNLDLPAAEDRLQQIRTMPEYGTRVGTLAGALGSACFAYLFGGGPADMAAAFVAGVVEQMVTRLCVRLHISRIFSDIVAAAAAMAVALLCHGLFPVVNANYAIIGALMVLTPGVALVMGIRDFINGDYLSGTIRLINALFIAGCL